MDAKRMIRATERIARDLLRSAHNANGAEKPRPEKKNIKIYVTMNGRVGIPFREHWNATRQEFHVDISKGP
jgi:hypothetical protein